MQSPKAMARRLEVWPIDRLRPYARNPRTHSDEQIEQLCRSMQEFGFTNPILVDSDDGIIAGHGRLAAARRLGLEEVPVVVLDGLTEDQRKAYLIADNRLPENAGWSEELLAEILSELDEAEFDLSVIGFTDDELAELLASAEDDPPGAGAEDEIPDEPEVPVSRPGDVWLLGKHRLVCGDSTDADTVALALAGETPHLMVTDPPYGVEYDANWRNEANWSDGDHGGRAIGRVQNDDRCDWREAWALFAGDVAYVWHGGVHAHEVADSLHACGFELRAQVIWAKSRHVISRGHYHWQHEPCWYAVRRGRTGHWQGARDQMTLWPISHNRSETGHSTQKPVEAMRRPIENNSRRGEAVYEPFSGSGTTIIAAEMTGRRCMAVELDPVYVDVAVLRWQQYTEQDAVLEADGRTFAEVREERQALALLAAERGGVMLTGRPFNDMGASNDPAYHLRRRA